jgi:hypothetical protein
LHDHFDLFPECVVLKREVQKWNRRLMPH